MSRPQRIIILGHTGLGKSAAVRNLAGEYLRRFHGIQTGLDHVDHAKYIRVACVEDHLEDIHAFLDLTNEVDARRRWSDARSEALTALDAGPSEAHRILSLHGSYYRKARAFSRADLEAIKNTFKPTAIVTLVDDVYEVASIVRRRDPLDALRLREIATWRSIEGMIGDFISGALQIPSYTLAVKHPSSMAVSLLFTPQTRVYSAFPISRHRDNRDDRMAIERFKARLRGEDLVVFDPSTIDEMLLRAALEEADVGAGDIEMRRSARWDVAGETLLSDGKESGWDGDSLMFSRSEVAEATQDITRQVESRDFRLIHDSELVIAYRPNWGGRPSRGVTAELHLARGIGRRSFIYSPPEDEEGEDSPFGDLGNVYATEEDLVAAVKAAAWKP